MNEDSGQIENRKPGKPVRHFCFPVIGLDFDKAIDPRDFLFHDATLLHGEDVKSLTESSSPDEDGLAPLDKTPLMVLRLPLIANDTNGAILFSEATRKAKELMAGIAIPLLAYSGFSSMPSLSHEVHSQQPQQAYYFDRKYFGLTTNYVLGLPIMVSDLYYRRKYLNEVLTRPPFKWMTEVLLMQECKTSLQCAIQTAATAFYVGINQPHPVSQFLGCYTALDTILNDGKHDNLMKRVKHLVGEEIFDLYYQDTNTKKTLDQIRTSIIHDGADCSRETVFACSRLVVQTLCVASYYAGMFKTKSELCGTVDLVRRLSADKGLDPFNLVDQWKQSERSDTLWKWMPERVASFYGLHKLEFDGARDNLLTMATALHDLQAKGNLDRASTYEQLSHAMYRSPMPFSDISAAWEFVDQNLSEVHERSWFVKGGL